MEKVKPTTNVYIFTSFAVLDGLEILALYDTTCIRF